MCECEVAHKCCLSEQASEDVRLCSCALRLERSFEREKYSMIGFIVQMITKKSYSNAVA